jgi:hypothetical protein
MLSEVVAGLFRRADGVQGPVRGGNSGEISVGNVHSDFFEAMLRGNLYCAANQAGSAITNLISAATGFILYNPVGSGIIGVLNEIGFIQTSAAAAANNAGLQLGANVNPALGAPSSTTALTVRNCQLGNLRTGALQAFSIATIGAVPVAVRNIWQPSVSATATLGIPGMIRDKVNGQIGILPGCCVSLSTLSALSGAADMVWEEVPFPC